VALEPAVAGRKQNAAQKQNIPHPEIDVGYQSRRQ
jgi:hypothetical protein